MWGARLNEGHWEGVEEWDDDDLKTWDPFCRDFAEIHIETYI